MLTREDIVNYFILYLKDRHPELDLRIGTAVRDLVIEPLADLFQNFINDLLNVSNFLTGDVQNKELLEKLLKNFFVERKKGFRASGLVRVFVGKKKIYRVPKGTRFYVTEDRWFETQEEYVFSASDLYYNSLENLWYFEVPAVASDVGTAFNVKKETALEPYPFDTYVLKAEAATDFIGGEGEETLEEFTDRAYRSLVSRNLASSRSLKVVLGETFDDVVKVVPIGFGDPEMWRDYKESIQAHIGGHTDVWLKFSNPPKRVTVRTDLEGWIINAPGLLRILTPGVKILEVDRNTSFGPYPKVRTNVKSGQIEVEIVPQIKTVQTFLTRSDERLLTVNYLARAMIPVYLSGTIRVKLAPGVQVESVKSRLYEWVYYLEEFSISDMIDVLYDFGAVEVKMPLSINAKLITPDYEELDLVVTDRFEVSDREVSGRTVTFYDGGLEVVPV